MSEINQSGTAPFSPVDFLAQGCRRLIERCERLEAALSEKSAALKSQPSRKEFDELQARWKRLKAEYDKLAKSKLGRLTLWYWRIKDRRKA